MATDRPKIDFGQQIRVGTFNVTARAKALVLQVLDSGRLSDGFKAGPSCGYALRAAFERRNDRRAEVSR